MNDPVVLFETLQTASGHVFGRATLNDPDSLNAVSVAMISLLEPQLAKWAADPRVAGVFLDARGERAFSAGGDVVGLYNAMKDADPGNVPAYAADFFEREYRLDHQIHRYPKPVLAWAHGIVMGGGLGLMIGASHRVGTERTRMAMPEISIGLFPDVGGSWLLPRLPGRSGLFLALTGSALGAADARFAGMLDFVLPHASQSAVLQAIAATSWQGNHDDDAAALTHLLQRLHQDMELPPSMLRMHWDRIDAAIGHDRLQDVAPRLSTLAEDPDPWLARAGATFKRGSPTSIALAWEMQRRARHLSLADAFRLEWQAAVGCCMHHDFPEGARALLIDKDKNPRWRPATLDAVTPELVAAHLRPRFDGAHPLADLA
ncbi:MAG: enoyl-CoA hydratase/isomerase family protein [Ottowia sp.]|nr:enoyl-CoA hydratase/isomerase family protein [Ottowia sp.]